MTARLTFSGRGGSVREFMLWPGDLEAIIQGLAQRQSNNASAYDHRLADLIDSFRLAKRMEETHDAENA